MIISYPINMNLSFKHSQYTLILSGSQLYISEMPWTPQFNILRLLMEDFSGSSWIHDTSPVNNSRGSRSCWAILDRCSAVLKVERSSTLAL